MIYLDYEAKLLELVETIKLGHRYLREQSNEGLEIEGRFGNFE